MPKPVHFYHHWTGGKPDLDQVITDEHFAALEESGFDGLIEVRDVAVGWEDVTLRELHSWCQELDPDTPVFYAHNKGALHPMYLRDTVTKQVYPQEFVSLWRGDLNDRLIRCWRSRVEDLRDYDIAGCYWVTPPESLAPHFPGNFWWARAEYIAGLPVLDVLDSTNRHNAERWLGRGTPRVKALSEGFGSIPLPPTPGATSVEWWSDEDN